MLLLSHNVLWDLAGGALGGLGFLEWLDLSYNQLVHLSMGFLATLGSLFHLDLSHNLLATLDPCSLWGLGNLKQLDLSHSQAQGPLLPTVALADFHWLGTSCSKLGMQPWPPCEAWRSSRWE